MKLHRGLIAAFFAILALTFAQVAHFVGEDQTVSSSTAIGAAMQNTVQRPFLASKPSEYNPHNPAASAPTSIIPTTTTTASAAAQTSGITNNVNQDEIPTGVCSPNLLIIRSLHWLGPALATGMPNLDIYDFALHYPVKHAFAIFVLGWVGVAISVLAVCADYQCGVSVGEFRNKVTALVFAWAAAVRLSIRLGVVIQAVKGERKEEEEKARREGKELEDGRGWLEKVLEWMFT